MLLSEKAKTKIFALIIFVDICRIQANNQIFFSLLTAYQFFLRNYSTILETFTIRFCLWTDYVLKFRPKFHFHLQILLLTIFWFIIVIVTFCLLYHWRFIKPLCDHSDLTLTNFQIFLENFRTFIHRTQQIFLKFFFFFSLVRSVWNINVN